MDRKDTNQLLGSGNGLEQAGNQGLLLEDRGGVRYESLPRYDGVFLEVCPRANSRPSVELVPCRPYDVPAFFTCSYIASLKATLAAFYY